MTLFLFEAEIHPLCPHVSLVMGRTAARRIPMKELSATETAFCRSTKLSRISLALALLFTWVGCSNGPEAGPGPARQNSPETEGYKSRIEISTIGLAKGENYLGNEVYYVEGSLKNNGEQLVQRIELSFVFRDSLNQVVLKQSRKAVEYKGARGLEPQKSARFQVAFDHLPRDWNRVVPEVGVSQVTLK
jgi:hypothetical protein